MIVVGSLALWTAVPVGWMYFTSGLVEDGGARFVLVIFGCPHTMALVFWALSRVEARRQALSPTPAEDTGGGDDDERPRHSLLEVMLVVSAAIGVVALVLWWFLIADAADPSGPLQPI